MPSSARLISWTSACFGAIALLMVSCTKKREGDADPARRIATEASLSLPAGTRVLQFSEPEAIVDPVWAAKLELPEASLAEFMRVLDAKQADPTSVHNRFAKSVGWWQPKAALTAKQYLADRQTLVNVIVSKEDQKVVAYVECMVF